MPEALIPVDYDLIVLLATRYALTHDDEDESIRVAKYIRESVGVLRTETVKELREYIGDAMRYGNHLGSGDLQDIWWNVWENICEELDAREMRKLAEAVGERCKIIDKKDEKQEDKQS